MSKRTRQFVILMLLVMVTAIYLNGTRIMNPVGVNSNVSNLSYFGTGDSWNSLLFGDHRKWASMQNYVNLLNEYEYKRNYGLLDHSGEAGYMTRFSDVASNAISDWQTHHARSAGKWLAREADEYFGLESLRQTKSPVLLVGVLAAAYAGRTLRYRLDGDHQFEAKTSMNQTNFEQQYLGFRSNRFEVSAGAIYDAEGQPALSLRKQISRELSVSYDHSKEQAIGVNYSTGF